MNVGGFSQISDAIKAGRFRESLSFLGGIRNTGVNISLLCPAPGRNADQALQLFHLHSCAWIQLFLHDDRLNLLASVTSSAV